MTDYRIPDDGVKRRILSSGRKLDDAKHWTDILAQCVVGVGDSYSFVDELNPVDFWRDVRIVQNQAADIGRQERTDRLMVRPGDTGYGFSAIQ